MVDHESGEHDLLAGAADSEMSSSEQPTPLRRRLLLSGSLIVLVVVAICTAVGAAVFSPTQKGLDAHGSGDWRQELIEKDAAFLYDTDGQLVYGVLKAKEGVEWLVGKLKQHKEEAKEFAQTVKDLRDKAKKFEEECKKEETCKHLVSSSHSTMKSPPIPQHFVGKWWVDTQKEDTDGQIKNSMWVVEYNFIAVFRDGKTNPHHSGDLTLWVDTWQVSQDGTQLTFNFNRDGHPFEQTWKFEKDGYLTLTMKDNRKFYLRRVADNL